MDIREDYLFHYGTPRHSGRYPWGSGDNPYQHSGFLETVHQLRKEGLKETEIANYFGINTSQLRARISISTAQVTEARRTQAQKLRDKGMGWTAIGKQMGLSESTVRSLLEPNRQSRAKKHEVIAEQLKNCVKEKTYVDVGSGVEYQLGISQTQLKTALAILEEEGYKTENIFVEQAGNPGNYTTVKVLVANDVTKKEINENKEKISSPMGVYFEDQGRTVRNIKPPVSISSDRVAINYSKKDAKGNEIGGALKEGVIELRPGVADISLGQSQYAQVRIAVDGTHYLKGMAMYSNNLPDGVDVMLNTKKSPDIPKMEVLKKMKDDPDNPFGATVRQRDYEDSNGNKHQSAINIVNDDSDWGHWSRTLSSQVLSKQTPELAKRQLNIKYSEKEMEYKQIMSIPNESLKKALLMPFAESCDADSVHLKAAALPRQETKVILPITKIKDTEIYAPTFKNGEQVALIRYPHGGIFEIPILTVNNNNAEGKDILKQAKNAVGINANVAAKLSGADFDGDTVTVIPIKGQNIQSKGTLQGLKNFDDIEAYPAYEGMPKVKDGVNFDKQMEMGKVSNLITDMTLQGASEEKLARAVRHSMVVIDAEKHNLDWKRSEIENGIPQLKAEYQGKPNGGASTLISKASAEYDIPKRKKWTGEIDPDTGKKIYHETGQTKNERKKDKKTGEYYDTGKEVLVKQKSTKMDNAYDTGGNAYDLINKNRPTTMEYIYAEHADKLRALGNEARKSYLAATPAKKNTAAADIYAEEVRSLNTKLNQALLNAPRERQAQIFASKVVEQKISADPTLRSKNRKDDLNKVRQQALAEGRARSGSISRGDKFDRETGELVKEGRAIKITDKEWEAIEAGAISKTKLEQIFNNADLDALKEKAMPRDNKEINNAKLARAQALLAAGYTQAEVAEAVGLSVSTINKYVA